MVGTLVGRYSCAMSWHNLDLTFDLAVVTLTYKILYDITDDKSNPCLIAPPLIYSE